MILTVHTRPNARQTAIRAWLDPTTAKIDVAAAPEKGRANAELIAFLAKHYGVAKSRIEVTRGATARMKQVTITGIDS